MYRIYVENLSTHTSTPTYHRGEDVAKLEQKAKQLRAFLFKKYGDGAFRVYLQFEREVEYNVYNGIGMWMGCYSKEECDRLMLNDEWTYEEI